MSKKHRLAISIATVVLATGCSTTTSSVYDHGRDDEVMADSLVEVFQRELDREEDPFVVDVLERAVSTGSITQADYDAVFDLYKRCMADIGYVDSAHKRNENGTIQVAPPEDLRSKEDFQQYMAAGTGCSAQLAPIESLFMIQQSNPDLLVDPLTVVIRCLADQGVTGDAYSEQQLQKDLESDEPFPFDVDTPKAQDCFTRVGFAVEGGDGSR
jgi:hypothetical protein